MVYIGGKKKLSKFICPILQKELDNGDYSAYVEPFVGGCSIIENIDFKLKVGYDINEELIAFWQALQNGWKMPEPNSFDAKHYNEVKKSYKDKDGKYPKYYYGYMMTIPSYNGKIWGSFAKDGKRLYQKEHYENVVDQISKIKDIIFKNEDYKNLKLKNCLIYCDPPYADSKKNYYDKDFNSNEFWKWCKIMSKNNKVFISETVAPENFVKVWEKEYKRTVANQSKGIQTTEKLFTI